MTDYSDFATQLRDYQNRQDWTDALVAGFVAMANQKFNQELRVARMIQTDNGLLTERSAELPDDWLEMSLVRVANDCAPSGFRPIHYKARDEFFRIPDKWAWNFYTIEGRQIFFGGTPDIVNGIQYQISYYGEVPAFSDAVPSWIYTKYPSLYLSAASFFAYLHAVGEEQTASLAKQLTEDQITKLNDEWRMAKASGSRLTRTRTRSFG